jgi:hypothetical protein
MGITFTNDNATISSSEYSLPNDGTTLTPQTTDGVYQFFVDLSNVSAADQYRLRLYEKCDASGTQWLVEEWIFTNNQSKPIFVSPSFILGEGWDFTVTKLSGTDRIIFWSIRRVA